MFDTSHLHPMLVHFPIALVMFGFIIELASLIIKKELCLPKLSLYLLVTGTLATVVTWLSGELFTSEMSGAAGSVKESHELFAFITMCLLIVTSVIRLMLASGKKENSTLKWISFILYGIAAITVSITGFFGGTLVYNYMMPL
ncbi:DUF2231 domain-containing protein [uncultured Bacteroides sp.]|uniref:DUF2231 domain-containing protein n=1 Tax=uncultured Bacteroides sp. TaxID=162156 RepID=UPI002AA61AF7|nr:DUF2231 domain-containing protein [uncultured Bacteroides sp.]